MSVQQRSSTLVFADSSSDKSFATFRGDISLIMDDVLDDCEYTLECDTNQPYLVATIEKPTNIKLYVF